MQQKKNKYKYKYKNKETEGQKKDKKKRVYDTSKFSFNSFLLKRRAAPTARRWRATRCAQCVQRSKQQPIVLSRDWRHRNQSNQTRLKKMKRQLALNRQRSSSRSQKIAIAVGESIAVRHHSTNALWWWWSLIDRRRRQ